MIYKPTCSLLTECAAVFDGKQQDPSLCPTIPDSPDLALSNFFVSADEKSPQREMFTDIEEMKQKRTEVLKGIKIEEFKNLF